jgi:lipopolysaccharide transport system permease protein
MVVLGDDQKKDVERAADRWVENRPSRGGRALRPRELWEHRSLIVFLTGRNLKVRYKQAALGVGWAFIQPIVAGLTLTLVFGRLAHVGSDGVPYLPFVMLGYSGWSLFSNGVTLSTTSLVVDRPLITKVYFPRVLIPLSTVLPGFVDFALAMIPLAVVMTVTGVSPGIGLVTLPLWVLAIGVVSLGVGLVFATLNVRYRDAAALLGILIQLLFFLSPVIYPASKVHGAFRWVYALNPMAGLLTGLRWSLLQTPLPGLPLVVSLTSGGLIFASSLVYFSVAERHFADVI